MRFRTKDIGVLDRSACGCGRTFVRMTKPMGRTDDMLIIRGVNVFPSQIETVLMNQGYPANYQIVVDRIGNNDTIEVQVELTPEMVENPTLSIPGVFSKILAIIKQLFFIVALIFCQRDSKSSLGTSIGILQKGVKAAKISFDVFPFDKADSYVLPIFPKAAKLFDPSSFSS